MPDGTMPDYTLITNFTLITNVREARMRGNGLRLNAHALLLERTAGMHFNEGQIRGFGVDGADPTFSLRLPRSDYEYAFTDAATNSIFIGNDGVEKPLFQAAILSIDGDPLMDVFVENADAELCIVEFDEAPQVWAALPRLVARYWQAPNIKVIDYRPAAWVRAALDTRVTGGRT